MADRTTAAALLEQPRACDVLRADKGYDANADRRQVEERGATPNIPPKTNRKWKNRFPSFLYRNRNAHRCHPEVEPSPNHWARSAPDERRIGDFAPSLPSCAVRQPEKSKDDPRPIVTPNEFFGIADLRLRTESARRMKRQALS